ncbi:methyltransferase [Pectobacterium aroidearum]|uniref:methyltransferase n=1 Tax=Pectobacterium aroidearum TaxID=1201031 RepID=UPI003306D5B4
MVEYKQFYTESDVSAKLSNSIEAINPENCLELSAGEGALIAAILDKHPKLSITAVDIDCKNSLILKDKFPEAEVICGDSTSSNIYESIYDESYDIALCNPPFKKIPSSELINFILKDVTGERNKRKSIRSEIVFLLINLKKLKPLGELAIILPDMFFTSLRYSWLRAYLVNNFSLIKVIECEHNSFRKTEAKTHIYHIIKKCPDRLSSVCFLSANKSIKLSYDEFISAHKKNTSLHDFDNLFFLFRGKLSGKECRLSGLPYFHTTSFVANTYMSDKIIEKSEKCAMEGDILIARVGTRVIGKTTIFSSPPSLVSDCIFCLRIKDLRVRDFFLTHWNADKNDWLAKHAKGTCAKNISLTVFKDYVRSVLQLYSENHS